MLTLTQVQTHYGKVRVLNEVSLTVGDSELVTLIGANGAGKTTLVRTISGLVRVTSGELSFNNERIDRMSPSDIVVRGIAHCPEGRKVFKDLTVLENLIMGAYARGRKIDLQSELEEVYNYFPRLKERKNQKAGTLSGGEQQMLAIGRALMARPKLLLLDEPSLGLAPIIVDEIFEIITDISKKGTAILLIEQNVNLALQVANRGYVIENGRIVQQGSAVELSESPQVVEAYLGG